MIVGLYGVSLCLLMPSVLSIGGFGELGELCVVFAADLNLHSSFSLTPQFCEPARFI